MLLVYRAHPIVLQTGWEWICLKLAAGGGFMIHFFEQVVRELERSSRFASGLISRVKGASPQKQGAKALFLADGRPELANAEHFPAGVHLRLGNWGHLLETPLRAQAAPGLISPVGLDIAAASVQKIAVSILAQYVQKRAGRGARALCPA